MYRSPKLLRHGSFRELTQSGLSGSRDQLFFMSIVAPPSDPTPPPPEVQIFTTLDVAGSR